MNFGALFCILFGFVVILFPQFLAYLIGIFFIIIGINILVMRTIWNSRKTGSKNSYQFGEYEITRRNR